MKYNRFIGTGGDTVVVLAGQPVVVTEFNKNHDAIGQFATSPGLRAIYEKHPSVEQGLKDIEAAGKLYNKPEIDRLDKIHGDLNREQHAVWKKMYAMDKKMKAEGKSYDEIHKDPEYMKLDKQYDATRKKSKDAWGNYERENSKAWRAQWLAKEKMYKAEYGDMAQEKMAAASKAIQMWGENRYGLSKKAIANGDIELETALSQAYFMKKGQKEVDVYWGVYGPTALEMLSNNIKIRKSVSSVTNKPDIAEDYAGMGRMTSGTLRHIKNRTSTLPEQGALVHAKIPTSDILISYKTVARGHTSMRPSEASFDATVGSFLDYDSEFIVNIPKDLKIEKILPVETLDAAHSLNEAMRQGKRWEDVR